MQTFYKWKHLKKETTYRCEFDLQGVFSKRFTADTVYEEDSKACNRKAEYQISDSKNDYWMCRKHIHSLFPAVGEEMVEKEGYKNKGYMRRILKND